MCLCFFEADLITLGLDVEQPAERVVVVEPLQLAVAIKVKQAVADAYPAQTLAVDIRGHNGGAHAVELRVLRDVLGDGLIADLER